MGFRFVIIAFHNLAESSFSNLLYDFESISKMISFLESIITIIVVIAVIDQPLSLACVKLGLIESQEENFIVF